MEIRDLILAEAEQIVLTEGPAQLRVTVLARRLGMSHANVYRFFESRQALVVAVAEKHLALSLAVVAAAVSDGGSCLARLEAAAVAMARHKQQQRTSGAHRVVQMVLTETPELAMRHLGAQHALLTALLAEGVALGELAPGADPAAVATTILDALAALYHPAVLSPSLDSLPLEVRASRLVGLLSEGLRRRTDA